MDGQIRRVSLTVGRIQRFACLPGRLQSFLWDTDTPSLALRATPSGRKTYVFEARLSGKTMRINIGTVSDWSIKAARAWAGELKTLVDRGIDPREQRREQDAAKAAAALAEQAATVEREKAARRAALTVGEAWSVYLEARRRYWGDHHYKDHLKLARGSGVPAKRGTDGRASPSTCRSLR